MTGRSSARLTCAAAVAISLLLCAAPLAQADRQAPVSRRPIANRAHLTSVRPTSFTGHIPGLRAPSARHLASTDLLFPSAEAWAAGSALDWEWQNPKPTGLALSDVRFLDASTGWINGPSTMLKTTDGGATWTREDPGTEFDGGKFSFLDANHGWCTESFDVLRTADGGATWTPCNVFDSEGAGDSISTNGFTDPAYVSANVGYVLETYGGVHKTTDGGATWKVLPGTKGWMPEAADFIDVNTGWVAGWDGIFKTTNGGATWVKEPSPVNDPYGGFGSIDFIDANIGWIAGSNGVYKTTNGGATWKAEQTGFGTSAQIDSVRFLDSAHGWMTASDLLSSMPPQRQGIVLRTDDGGLHWTSTELPDGGIGGLSFTDTSHGWLAGGTSTDGCLLEKSADGGKTWSAETTGSTATLYDVSAPSTSTAIAVGAEGTILRTSDGGAAWMPADSEATSTLWSLASASPTETWAVGDVGAIRHTVDGGATWETQNAGTSAWLGSVSFTDSLHGWAGGSEGTLVHTIDGGAHWQAVSTAPQHDLYGVEFVDVNTGWLIADADHSLYKTTDGGVTWTPQGPDFWEANAPSYIAFADAQHGWVADSNGGVAHTTDGGATWTEQYLRVDSSARAIHALDPSTAVLITQDGKVLRTDDGGSGWWLQVAPGGAPEDIDFADSQHGWVVGRNGFIAATTNGGGATPLPSQLGGIVRSAFNHKPLGGVSVVLPTYPAAHTDASGHYLIPNVMPGWYEDVLFFKSGFALGAEPYVAFSDDDQEVLDFSLYAKASATIGSARSVHGRLAVYGTILPRRRATVTLEYYRLVGKTFVRKSSEKVKSDAVGVFHRTRKLGKGTWRVRAKTSVANGCTASMSSWRLVKVR